MINLAAMKKGAPIYELYDVVEPHPQHDPSKDKIKCKYCDYTVIRRSNRCLRHSKQCSNTPRELKLKYIDESTLNDEDGELRWGSGLNK